MRKTDKLRREGISKLTGAEKYIDDIKMDSMIFGTTVRSPVPRGTLKKIIFDDSYDWSEFTIVTAKDIPGKNYISMIENDWPVLVDKEINFKGEPIVLLAHSNKYLLEEAKSKISFEIEEKRPIFTIEESLNQTEVILKKDNIIKEYKIKKGDVDSIWEKAHKIVEGVYRTGAHEHLYIENNGMIATASENNVTVWGSLQCPYYVHSALGPIFNLENEQVRVVQVATGGGFGGKEDFPSYLAAHTALLALKAKLPVKIIYSRTEDLANTTKRHPSKSYCKTAVDKNGKILAMQMDFYLDGGAYTTLSPVVLSRGCIHGAGPYKVDNVLINAKAVATNTFPHGAFRGFGAPQSIFATEVHMDKVAKEIGMDPIEFRKINFFKTGDETATGQVLKERVDYDELIKKTLSDSKYDQKINTFKEENKNSHIKKGLGISTFFHGAGFTGSGEAYLASIAEVDTTKEGKIRALASSVEMGQGKDTVFATIISEALGVNYDDVIIPMPDTNLVPNSGPTVASRTVMVVGQLLKEAALGLKDILINSKFLKENYNRDDFVEAVKKYHQEVGPLKNRTKYKQPPNVHWDDENYQGEAYATYAWAVYLAEVSVNTLTYETKVENFYSNQEVGKVMNSTLAQGQIEGGIAQGIGHAIFEKVRYENGQMINNQMTNYIVPTAGDLGPIHVNFEEWNQDYGPSGAKGIGELPMDGPAPAVINAINNALGTYVNEVPMLPENLHEVLS